MDIKVVDISWLSNYTNMKKFYEFMSDFDDPKGFDVELVKTLLDDQDYSM